MNIKSQSDERLKKGLDNVLTLTANLMPVTDLYL